MKKIIMMVLFGLSLVTSCFGQRINTKRDSISYGLITKVKDSSGLIGLIRYGSINRRNNRNIHYNSIDTSLKIDYNLIKPSSYLLKSYSDQLISKEILTISGSILTLIGINMIKNGYDKQNSGNFQHQSKADVSIENGRTLCFLGGCLFTASYVIHLNSLGTLNKYSRRLILEKTLH